MLRIRLTRKLAERLNGVDLTGFRAGEVIELPDQAARMLLAEGWAEKVVEKPLPMTRPAISPT
ncbi:MAG: hypothetical protein ACRD1Q_04390 [Vicinamibacterales bacterium]